MTTAIDFKVVVAGPFGAGKTRLITHISQTPVVGTEATTSGDEADRKATTTVGMEYGAYRVDGGDVAAQLHLYGVPGQERFSFMWQIVGDGCDAVLLLVDGSDPLSWQDASGVSSWFREHIGAPILVGVTGDDGSDAAVERVRAALSDPDALYLPCDVNDEASARRALIALLTMLLAQLDPEDPDGRRG
jgi:uncharacterized protein